MIDDGEFSFSLFPFIHSQRIEGTDMDSPEDDLLFTNMLWQ